MASKRKCKLTGEYILKTEGYLSANNMFFKDRDSAIQWSIESQEAKRKAARIKKESLREVKAKAVKRKQALKSIGQLKKEAEQAVNAYIRIRDLGKPCCSCGKPHKKGDQAGHFIAVGDCDYLRFWTTNIHSQCVGCNLYGRGAYRTYRPFMIDKYGEEYVLNLEQIASTNPIHKPTRAHLERMKRVFNKRVKHLVNLRKRKVA